MTKVVTSWIKNHTIICSVLKHHVGTKNIGTDNYGDLSDIGQERLGHLETEILTTNLQQIYFISETRHFDDGYSIQWGICEQEMQILRIV